MEIIRGQARNRLRSLPTDTFLIGSAARCHLVLCDPAVPALHSFIYRTETRLVVCHLGQEPALLINGFGVTRMALEAGDRITIGPFELAVYLPLPRSPAIERRRAVMAHRVELQDGRHRVATLCAEVSSAIEQMRSALRLYPEPEHTSDVGRLPPAQTAATTPARRAVSRTG